MKRNIALLLAGVLITSAAPTKVSAQQLGNYSTTSERKTAAITSSITRSPIPAQPKTLFVSPGAENKDKAGSVTGNDDVENWVTGGYFEITVPEAAKKGNPEGVKVTVKLKNAEWYFGGKNLGVNLFGKDEGSFDDRTNTFISFKKGNEYKLEISRTDASTAIFSLKGEEDAKEEKLYDKVNGVIKEIKSIVGADDTKPGLYGELKALRDAKELKGEPVGELTLLPAELEETADSSNVENGSLLLESLDADLLNENDNESKEEAKKEAKKEIDDIEAALKKLSSELDKIKDSKSDEELKEKEINLKAVVEAITSNNGLAKQSTKKLEALLKDEKSIELLDKVKATIKKLSNETGSEKGLAQKLNELIKQINQGNKAGEGNELTTYQIPIVARTIKEGEDSSVSLINSNSLPVENDSKIFAIGTKEGLTTTSVPNPITARTKFRIDTIGIKENRISSLPKSGSFMITAPSGYEFIKPESAILETEGGISKIDDKNLSDKEKFNFSISKYNNNPSILVVSYNNINQSKSITGSLILQGIELVSTSYNDSVIEKDLYMTIKSIAGNVVTPQVFLVAYARDWKINLSAIGPVPVLTNGRLDSVEKEDINDESHKAVTVKFEEQVSNTWMGERITRFELPENVKIRRAVFTKVKNVSDKESLSGIYYNDRKSRSGCVRIDDNVLTLNGITGSKGQKASFELNLWLSIEPGYKGNVDLKLSGSAINNEKESSIVIAKVIDPIEVKADLTDAKVGYDYVTLGDFTITETAAGRLKQNEDVYISIVSNNSSTMIVDPSFKYEVTNGDIRIRNMDTTNTQLQLGNSINNKVNGVNIMFRVDKASTKASSIKFSNIRVRVNDKYNTQPKEKFDLVVWGPSVANNYRGLISYNDKYKNREDDKINENDYFYKPGIIVPYVNADITNNKGLFKNVVKVKVGNPVILVNDKEVAMPTAAYISKLSNSTMVPVRFISTALGIDESKIVWNEATGTVTINAGNRIVQMTAGKDVIKINDTELPMLSPDGLKVTVEIKDDRAFIPFRALGEAFGISVGWNVETATATYNDQAISNLLPNRI